MQWEVFKDLNIFVYFMGSIIRRTFAPVSVTHLFSVWKLLHHPWFTSVDCPIAYIVFQTVCLVVRGVPLPPPLFVTFQSRKLLISLCVMHASCARSALLPQHNACGLNSHSLNRDIVSGQLFASAQSEKRATV